MDESAQNLIDAINDLTKQLEVVAGDTGVVAVLVDSITKAVARVRAFLMFSISHLLPEVMPCLTSV